MMLRLFLDSLFKKIVFLAMVRAVRRILAEGEVLGSYDPERLPKMWPEEEKDMALQNVR